MSTGRLSGGLMSTGRLSGGLLSTGQLSEKILLTGRLSHWLIDFMGHCRLAYYLVRDYRLGDCLVSNNRLAIYRLADCLFCKTGRIFVSDCPVSDCRVSYCRTSTKKAPIQIHQQSDIHTCYIFTTFIPYYARKSHTLQSSPGDTQTHIINCRRLSTQKEGTGL